MIVYSLEQAVDIDAVKGVFQAARGEAVPLVGFPVAHNEAIKAHAPRSVSILCPECGEMGADQYADHGGLCVCQGCGITFDPSVEMYDA